MRLKRVLLFLVLILLLLIAGCKANNKYEFAQTIDNMKKVEIIKVEEGEETALIELDSFDIISDIQDLSCEKYWNDPCQVINGLAVKIYYDDSSYEIITWECNVFCENEICDYGWEYFDMEEFNSTIESYLDS